MSPQSTITEFSSEEALSLAVSYYEVNNTPEGGISGKVEENKQRLSMRAVACSHGVPYNILQRWLAGNEEYYRKAHQSQ